MTARFKIDQVTALSWSNISGFRIVAAITPGLPIQTNMSCQFISDTRQPATLPDLEKIASGIAGTLTIDSDEKTQKLKYIFEEIDVVSAHLEKDEYGHVKHFITFRFLNDQLDYVKKVKSECESDDSGGRGGYESAGGIACLGSNVITDKGMPLLSSAVVFFGNGSGALHLRALRTQKNSWGEALRYVSANAGNQLTLTLDGKDIDLGGASPNASLIVYEELFGRFIHVPPPTNHQLKEWAPGVVAGVTMPEEFFARDLSHVWAWSGKGNFTPGTHVIERIGIWCNKGLENFYGWRP